MSSLLHFISWICNYAFSEKGEGRERSRFASLRIPVSVSMESPCLGREEEKSARSASWGREGPPRTHPLAGLIAMQIWGRGLPCLSIITMQNSWYWPCSVNPGQPWKLTGSSILWTQNPFKLRKPCYTLLAWEFIFSFYVSLFSVIV